MKRVRTTRQAVNALKSGKSVEILMDQKGQPKQLIEAVTKDVAATTRVLPGSRFKAVQFRPPDEAT